MSTKKPKPITAPQATSSKSTYILGALAVLVIAVVVIGGVLWSNNRSKPRNEGYGGVSNPAVQVTTDADGVVRLGLPDATTTIDLYEDPMCPYCAQLEHTNGQEMAQKIDEGGLAIKYHTLNFLDRLSASGDYSSRAAGALLCVADSGNAIAYSAFHTALFSEDVQPEENGKSDHSNSDLAGIAGDAGANDQAKACISDGAKVDQAKASAEAGRVALSATGAAGTPAVIKDGVVIDALGNPGWVADLN